MYSERLSAHFHYAHINVRSKWKRENSLDHIHWGLRIISLWIYEHKNGTKKSNAWRFIDFISNILLALSVNGFSLCFAGTLTLFLQQTKLKNAREWEGKNSQRSRLFGWSMRVLYALVEACVVFPTQFNVYFNHAFSHICSISFILFHSRTMANRT